jgi:hypothetical protein
MKLYVQQVGNISNRSMYSVLHSIFVLQQFNNHISQVHNYGLLHSRWARSLCAISLLLRVFLSFSSTNGLQFLLQGRGGKQVQEQALFCTRGTLWICAYKSQRRQSVCSLAIHALRASRRITGDSQHSVSCAGCATSSVSMGMRVLLPLAAGWRRRNKWRKCLDKGDANFFLPISTGRKTTPSASPYYYYYWSWSLRRVCCLHEVNAKTLGAASVKFPLVHAARMNENIFQLCKEDKKLSEQRWIQTGNKILRKR